MHLEFMIFVFHGFVIDIATIASTHLAGGFVIAFQEETSFSPGLASLNSLRANKGDGWIGEGSTPMDIYQWDMPRQLSPRPQHLVPPTPPRPSLGLQYLKVAGKAGSFEALPPLGAQK